MSDEAVEYVARAMYAAKWPAVDWNDAPESFREGYRTRARIPVAALTSPRPCPTCGGRATERFDSPAPVPDVPKVCKTCHGTGVLDSLAVLRSDLLPAVLIGDRPIRMCAYHGKPDFCSDDGEVVFILRTSREVPE